MYTVTTTVLFTFYVLCLRSYQLAEFRCASDVIKINELIETDKS